MFWTNQSEAPVELAEEFPKKARTPQPQRPRGGEMGVDVSAPKELLGGRPSQSESGFRWDGRLKKSLRRFGVSPGAKPKLAH